MAYYAALLPRRGPHVASHSVCPSVCLSVRPVRSVMERHLAPPSELQWHTEGRITYGHLGRTNLFCAACARLALSLLLWPSGSSGIGLHLLSASLVLKNERTDKLEPGFRMIKLIWCSGSHGNCIIERIAWNDLYLQIEMDGHTIFELRW